MKYGRIAVLATACLVVLLLSCNTSMGPSIPGDPVYVAQLNVLEGQLERMPPNTEYSLDDGATWGACDGNSVSVGFTVGDDVWIRPAETSGEERFLGTVEALSGRPDFVAGHRLYVGIYYSLDNSWDDVPHGAPGDTRYVYFYFQNCGDSSGFSASHKIRVYLSPDKEITAADELLEEIDYAWDCPVGELYGGTELVQIPASTPPGLYYIGVVIDATDAIDELSEGAAGSFGLNATQPEDVVEFRVVEDSISSSGAFKIVNSWGANPLDAWENIHDGHYWMTYQTIKAQQLPVFYYNNEFGHVYEPTILAVFQLTHPRRNECQVILGLGDPLAPVAVKRLMAQWESEVQSGAHPFPNNALAMDISEFASLINDYDLFLAVQNTGSTTCTVDSFHVEYYADYDSPPIETVSGDSGQVPARTSATVSCPTKDALSAAQLNQIRPLSRAAGRNTTLLEERPGTAELAGDMARIGVYRQGRNYNKIIHGRHGTGFQPPSREAWSGMSKLIRVDRGIYAGTYDNSQIDHSQSPHFPPIGDQGMEGSCTCFSIGYYIGTYMEAREHGWNLSTVSWNPSLGRPDSQRDKILSPDFLYHQINMGADGGSSSTDAASLMIQLGCSSWQEMPYNVADSSSWPSESAFREAPRYRGREVGNNYWAEEYTLHGGYFVVQSDADIGLLIALLEAGYCVSTAINADVVFPTNPPGTLLNDKDVLDLSVNITTTINHAQTIVGYKDGTAWDPLNPDP